MDCQKNSSTYLITYILILVLLQLFRRLKECQLIHFTEYCTAHLQICNLLMYIIIIQKILGKKTKILM